MIQEPILISNGKSDEITRCHRTGVIESSDIQRKRIAILQRNNMNLRLLGMTISKPDKTWEIITYPEADDGNYVVLGFDDSGVYQGDIMDKLALFNKTFLYNGSDLQKLGETIIKLNSTLIGVNRLVLNSFCNWLLDFKAEDLNRNYILTNIDNTTTYLNVKSVILDIEGGWGGSFIGIRRVEFYDLSNNKISLTSSDFTAYATSQYSTNALPRFAFETALSKIGVDTLTGWICANGTTTKQRLICVLNTPRDISKIVVNNYHVTGGTTIAGAKSVIVRVSSDEITSTVWGSAITNGKIIFGGDIPQHAVTDTVQDYMLPKYDISATPIGTGVKSIILDIKNCYNTTNYMGIRRVELYTPQGVLIPLTTSDMTCYNTTQNSTAYTATMAFTTALSKIGDWSYLQWLTPGGTLTNQRIICVLNTPRDIGFVIINNAHSSGNFTDSGAKETKIYFSTDAITSVSYNSIIANSVLVFDGTLPIHSPTNTIENIIILTKTGFNLTTLSGQVVDLSLLPLETGTTIKTIDDSSFVLSEIVDNKIIPTKVQSINYTIPVKSIEPLMPTNKITYDGRLNPCTIVSNSKIPLLCGDTLNSITVIEEKEGAVGAVAPPVPDTEYVGDFCLQSNTTQGSTVFEDVSLNAYPITVNGGITHTTSQFLYGTSSVVFDGSSKYLHIANNTSLEFGIDDFTIDFWIYFNNLNPQTLFELHSYDTGLAMFINGANLYIYGCGATQSVPTGDNIYVNTWTHIAMVRKSGIVKVYINGVEKITGTRSASVVTTNGLRIGKDMDIGSGYLNGYIATFRITKSKALWLANFTPPTVLYRLVNDTSIAESSKFLTITVNPDKITENLTGFPLTLVITDPAVFDYLNDFNKTKLKMVDKDNNTKYVEIAYWNDTEKRAVLYTKVDLTPTSTFKLFYEFGGEFNDAYTGVTGSIPAQKVWDSNFKAVYTMSQNPVTGSVCILDSTINANHGTPYGGMASGSLVDGLGGRKSIVFDGVDDYISCPSLCYSYPMTLNFTFYHTVGGCLLHQGDTEIDPQQGLRIYTTGNILTMYYLSGGWQTVSFGSLSLNAWNTCSMTLDNSTKTLNYTINGGSGSLTYPTVIPVSSQPFYIAAEKSYSLGAFSNVRIGFIGVSNIVRSPAWINTTNASLKNELVNISRNIAYKLTPKTGILTEDLTDFPITIVLSSPNINDSDLDIIFSKDYTCIRVENEMGTNLSTEVELWDSVNKKAVLHSKVPLLTSTSQIFVKVLDVVSRPVLRMTNPTSFLLLSDTTDGSTTFTDSSENAYPIAVTGTVTHQTAQTKLAASSIYLNGTSTIGTNSGIAFGTSDFTIHLWYRPTAKVGAYPCIIQNALDDVFNGNEWLLMERHNSLNPTKFMFNFSNYSMSAAFLLSTIDVVNGTWYHLAITRKANIFRLFVNGIKEAELTSTLALDGGVPKGIYLGGQPNGKIQGHIDGVSVTVGECLWEANFTPPTTTAFYLQQKPIYYVGMTGSKEAQQVWDSNFKAVYTMAQNPATGGACILDSTVNKNHGTPYGGMTSANLVDGLTGKALDFIKSNKQYIRVEHSQSLNLTNCTIEFFMTSKVDTFNNGVLMKNSLIGVAGCYGVSVRADGNYSFVINNTHPAALAVPVSPLGVPMYLGVSNTGTYAKCFQNDNLTTSIFTTAISNNSDPLIIGAYWTDNYTFSGVMEALRISNTSRSDAWMLVTNHSLRNELFTYVSSGGELIAKAHIYYSLSFDNKRTYKVWKNDAWRAIASNLDSVHGVSGDSNWYYRDDADVWSKTGVDNIIAPVLDKATSYPNNQMEKTALEGLTDTEYSATGGFVQSNGYFDIALSLVSLEYGMGAIVKDLVINDANKQVWELAPINIGVTSSAIGSSIRWAYNVDNTFDFESKVKIYALVSDKAGYSLCTNGSAIPQINVGDDLTGKQLFIKVVYDTVVLPAAVDPAASIVFNITIS